MVEKNNGLIGGDIDDTNTANCLGAFQGNPGLSSRSCWGLEDVQKGGGRNYSLQAQILGYWADNISGGTMA